MRSAGITANGASLWRPMCAVAISGPSWTRLNRQSPEACASPLARGSKWGGQFKNLQRAVRRLQLVVPICMVLIAGALYMALGSMPLTFTVFTAVPLAMAGGVFAIALRGIPFSVSAAVGFIAVSGVAVLNGLVLIASIQRRLELGEDGTGAIFNGALERVRPVLMTALVASLGFVPMAIATGTGAEVQRPLATVVIG